MQIKGDTDMEEKNIVAIDLGTSKIAITVAKVNGDDIQVIYYKEKPSFGVRYSSIYNIMHVTEPLSRIIQEAEEALDIRISQVVVGMPKYPIRQESNSAVIKDRGEDKDITAEDITDLKSYAEDSYPLEDESQEAIYGAVAQSFSDGENFQIIEDDIIGMASDLLEGHFKIFIGKKGDLKKIDTVMTKTGISARKKYFTAETTAKAVLTDAEMDNGVALIDFGGGCTSVTIYHGKVMRHYASIPFGGKNITSDIKSECQISERLAENIKLAYGVCMPEKLQSLSEKILQIRSGNSEPNKQITVKYLSEIITARIEEIIMAMLYEIEESGFADMLRSGIVITGGVAQTANLGNFISELSGYRVRTGYPQNNFSKVGCDGLNDTTAATSVGLLMAAKDELSMNCSFSIERSDSVIVEEGGYGQPAYCPAEETDDETQTTEPQQAPDDTQLTGQEEPKPVEEKKPKRNLLEGINIFWRNTIKKAEDAAEKIKEIREEEV